MTYRNIMVRLHPDASNAALLEFTADLASRFEARVVGIAATHPFPAAYGDSLAATTLALADAVMKETEALASAMSKCESQFRTAMKGWVRDVEWRSTISADSITGYIVKEARSADLIVTAMEEGLGINRLGAGELAIRAGRPVLIVPNGISRLKCGRMVIAWKDEREARRAVSDAIPMLKLAKACTIVEVTGLDEVASARQHLEDVAGWLASHGISSEVQSVGVSGSTGNSLVEELQRLQPDLVIAGAYGHNRLSEWVFGGVTRQTLLRSEFCVLLSH
jgi:nucleotide-binding universal stress UspA family protein